jgi:hypothetical protein
MNALRRPKPMQKEAQPLRSVQIHKNPPAADKRKGRIHQAYFIIVVSRWTVVRTVHGLKLSSHLDFSQLYGFPTASSRRTSFKILPK